MTLIVLLSVCLASCNGGLGIKTIRTDRHRVIIPESIPEDLLTVPECPEIDEITWGDARRASDQYRRCKDLRGQRIEDIATTVRGRWQWLRDQALAVEADNKEIEERLEGE